MRHYYFFLSGFFLSQTFMIHRTAGEGGGYSFKSSLPFLPASQTLRHLLGDYCRELTSSHSLQPDSNWKPLVCKCKLLTISYKEKKRLRLSYRRQDYEKKISQNLLYVCYTNILKQNLNLRPFIINHTFIIKTTTKNEMWDAVIILIILLNF